MAVGAAVGMAVHAALEADVSDPRSLTEGLDRVGRELAMAAAADGTGSSAYIGQYWEERSRRATYKNRS